MSSSTTASIGIASTAAGAQQPSQPHDHEQLQSHPLPVSSGSAPAPAPVAAAINTKADTYTNDNQAQDTNQAQAQGQDQGCGQTAVREMQVCVNCLHEISAEAAVAAFGQGRKIAVCVECMSSLMIQDKAARAKAAIAESGAGAVASSGDEPEGPKDPSAAGGGAGGGAGAGAGAGGVADQQHQVNGSKDQEDTAAWAVQIACRFHSNGCQFVGVLGPLLNAHESKCIQRPVTCEHCQTKTTVGELPVHRESCKLYPHPCPFGCGAAPIREQFAAHDAECPNKLVECKYPGCKARMPRGFIPAHEADSKDRHLTLALNAVVHHETTTSQLEAARAELGAAKAELGATKAELEAIRAAKATLEKRNRELEPCPQNSDCFARALLVTGQFINYAFDGQDWKLCRVHAAERDRIQIATSSRGETWFNISSFAQLSKPTAY